MSFTPEQREKGRLKRIANLKRKAAAVAVADEPLSEPQKLPAAHIEEFDDEWAAYTLSEAEKAEIDAEIKRQHRAEQKAAAKKAYAKEAIARERRKAGEEPEDEAAKRYLEEMVEVFVRCRGCASRLAAATSLSRSSSIRRFTLRAAPTESRGRWRSRSWTLWTRRGATFARLMATAWSTSIPDRSGSPIRAAALRAAAR